MMRSHKAVATLYFGGDLAEQMSTKSWRAILVGLPQCRPLAAVQELGSYQTIGYRRLNVLSMRQDSNYDLLRL
jgi:hypothetical protein